MTPIRSWSLRFPRSRNTPIDLSRMPPEYCDVLRCIAARIHSKRRVLRVTRELEIDSDTHEFQEERDVSFMRFVTVCFAVQTVTYSLKRRCKHRQSSTRESNERRCCSSGNDMPEPRTAASRIARRSRTIDLRRGVTAVLWLTRHRTRPRGSLVLISWCPVRTTRSSDTRHAPPIISALNRC